MAFRSARVRKATDNNNGTITANTSIKDNIFNFKLQGYSPYPNKGSRGLFYQ